MTTRKFNPNYSDRGPEPVSGEATIATPDEIGEEIEQHGLQRYLLPVMAAVMVMMVVGMLYFSFSGGPKNFQPQTMMFPLMFIMMGLSVFAARIGSNSKSVPELNAERKRYLRYLTDLRKRVATSAARQIEFWSYHAPHPDDLTGLVGKRRQWSRQANTAADNSEPQQHNKTRDYRDDLFLVTRVCTGTVPADDKLLRAEGEEGQLAGPDAGPKPYLEPVQYMWLIKFLRTHALIENCPKVISVKDHPTIAIGGDPTRTAGLLRAMLCHLALFHDPEALQIRVLTDNPDDPDWEWLKWLPHLHHNTAKGLNGPQRWISPNNVENIKDLLANGPHVRDAAPTGTYTVVLNLSGTTTYPTEGKAGVTYITLGQTRAEYQLSVNAEGTLRHVSRAPGASRTWEVLGTADCMSANAAAIFASRLAGWSITGEQLPTTKAVAEKLDTGFLAMIGANSPDEVTPARWREFPDGDRDRLRFPIGHQRPTGEIQALDIKEGAEFGMGPHGILIGTTGSGKSETLATLLLSGMADHGPNQLNLLLVDFKGGVSFIGMEDDPRVLAIITNLETERDLISRFKVVVRGEVHRRENLLRDSGFPSLAAYEEARQNGANLPPIPALLVVIDEFAEMMEVYPNFLDIFDQITRVGRSLRMHLLLATQAISNISKEWSKLEGKMGYKICLRTETSAESQQVIGTREAYYLKRGDEGAGYLKVGGDPPILFKTAYTGGKWQPPTDRQAVTSTTSATSPTKPAKKAPGLAVSMFTADSSRTPAA